MKLDITITASIPDEAGFDSVLSATEVISHALKQNQVIEVHEISVQVDDAE